MDAEVVKTIISPASSLSTFAAVASGKVLTAVGVAKTARSAATSPLRKPKKITPMLIQTMGTSIRRAITTMLIRVRLRTDALRLNEAPNDKKARGVVTEARLLIGEIIKLGSFHSLSARIRPRKPPIIIGLAMMPLITGKRELLLPL